MKHDFIPDNNNFWYKCKKCNIKYYNGEYISGFGRNDEFSAFSAIENLTCDEIIIKKIIE